MYNVLFTKKRNTHLKSNAAAKVYFKKGLKNDSCIVNCHILLCAPLKTSNSMKIPLSNLVTNNGSIGEFQISKLILKIVLTFGRFFELFRLFPPLPFPRFK